MGAQGAQRTSKMRKKKRKMAMMRIKTLNAGKLTYTVCLPHMKNEICRWKQFKVCGESQFWSTCVLLNMLWWHSALCATHAGGYCTKLYEKELCVVHSISQIKLRTLVQIRRFQQLA